MGKRIIALCCLLVLLCGCTVPEAADPASGPARSEETAAETTVGPRETQSEPPGHSVGYRVWTDYTNYTDYQPVLRKYTRLSEDPLPEFVPSDSYGRVFPYIASLRYISSEDGFSWRAGAAWGMMDASGRILTDGVYDNVEALLDYSVDSGADRYTGLWVVSRTVNVRTNEYGYMEGDTVYGLISADGSFALPCEYLSIGACGEWILCTRDWTTHDTEIRDKTGKLLFNKSELFDPEANETWINYGEGLYCLYQGAYLTDGGWVQSHLYFCDAACNRVLGPYRQGNAFSDGLACVSLDGRNFGYIDHSGAWVIEPKYSTGNSFEDGRAIQKRDGKYVLLDEKGTELIYTDYEISDVPCGYYLYSYGADSSWFYDRDGKLLFEGKNELYSSWYCLDEQTFYSVDSTGLAVVHSLDPEVEDIEIPKTSYIYAESVLLDGVERNVFCVVSSSYDATRYFTADLREDPELQNYLGGDANEYEDVDEITGKQYRFSRTEDGWRMEGPDGLIRQLPDRGSYYVLNGFLGHSFNNRAHCYYTLDGELIFSYPLDDQD